jgi:hypothetical protein
MELQLETRSCRCHRRWLFAFRVQYKLTDRVQSLRLRVFEVSLSLSPSLSLSLTQCETHVIRVETFRLEMPVACPVSATRRKRGTASADFASHAAAQRQVLTKSLNPCVSGRHHLLKSRRVHVDSSHLSRSDVGSVL